MGDDVREILIRIDERETSLEKRVDQLEADRSAVQEIAKLQAVMRSEQSQIASKVDALIAKVDVLESRPGKKWDTLIYAIIGALAGFVASVIWHGGL